MIFNCGAVNCRGPHRLAGTCSAYSGSAISQLTTTTKTRGFSLNRKCPYQATVMNRFERVSRITVRTEHSQLFPRINHNLRVLLHVRHDRLAQLVAIDLADLVFDVLELDRLSLLAA